MLVLHLEYFDSFHLMNGIYDSNTPSVPYNLSPFDPARILRNVIESGLEKLVVCESYFYILVL